LEHPTDWIAATFHQGQLTVMLVRRVFLAIAFGCLVGWAVPPPPRRRTIRGGRLTLGDKALAEIKNGAAARRRWKPFQGASGHLFRRPSISRFVLARYCGRPPTPSARSSPAVRGAGGAVLCCALLAIFRRDLQDRQGGESQPDPGDAIVHCQVQAAGQEPVRAEWRLKDNGATTASSTSRSKG